MLNYKEKYDNLIDRGYLIDFYEEERDYKVTGKYHAFCVPIKKKDKVELNHYSKGSYEKALIVALSL